MINGQVNPNMISDHGEPGGKRDLKIRLCPHQSSHDLYGLSLKGHQTKKSYDIAMCEIGVLFVNTQGII